MWAVWSRELDHDASIFSSTKIEEIQAWRDNQESDATSNVPGGCKRLLRALIVSAMHERDLPFLTEIVGLSESRARFAIGRAHLYVVNR